MVATIMHLGDMLALAGGLAQGKRQKCTRWAPYDREKNDAVMGLL